MGRKGRKNEPVPQSQRQVIEERIKSKYVKKAGQWCVTVIKKDGVQAQHWFDTKEKAEKFKLSVREEKNEGDK